MHAPYPLAKISLVNQQLSKYICICQFKLNFLYFIDINYNIKGSTKIPKSNSCYSMHQSVEGFYQAFEYNLGWIDRIGG